MVTTSDISDWVKTECFGSNKDKYAPPTAQDLVKMYEMSPIKYIANVKAPVLMALGMSDRRVPPSQGVEYYYSLKSRGIDAKMCTYKEDVHAIAKPESEADHWVNIKEWMDTYLKK